ncbi:MAG: FkbM family methyltransferase, partial [Xenococcaceae cyanobacterium]
KNIVYNLLYNRVMNLPLRKFASIFYPLIKNISYKMPIVGTISRKLNNGKKMSIDCNDNTLISTSCFFEGVYGFENETTVLMEKLLQSCQVFFDIGAHVGFYSLFAALENEKRSVYSFELVPNIYKKLQENVELNDLNNIHPVRAAFDRYDGEISMYIPVDPYHRGDNIPTISSTSSELKKSIDNVTEVAVKSLTLDSFVTKNNIDKIDLIKIDTEKTEPQVFERAKNAIERDRPIVICEVLPGRTENLLTKFFTNRNYEFFQITDSGLVAKNKIEGDIKYKFLNYLFIPQNKRLDLQNRLKLEIRSN